MSFRQLNGPATWSAPGNGFGRRSRPGGRDTWCALASENPRPDPGASEAGGGGTGGGGRGAGAGKAKGRDRGGMDDADGSGGSAADERRRRGRRPSPTSGRAGRGHGAGGGGARGTAPRRGARPAAAGREGLGDDALRAGWAGRPRLDHRHRGRRRRAQLDRHGHHGRGPLRGFPAAPAPRPGRPRELIRDCACSSPRHRSQARRASGSTPSRRPWTGSGCRSSTSSSARRATCSAQPRPAVRPP